MLPDLDHAALVAYAKGLVGTDDAEDVVQQAYVQMLSTTEVFKGASAKQTWATSIVRNCALDVLRSRESESRTRARLDGPEAHSTEAALEATHLLARLTPEERAWLEAHADETVRATARALGWTLHRVMSYRKYLKAKLER